MHKEVIIYGGAFNPPTVAHQAIAQAAADYAEKLGASLWLLPSGERFDKSIDVSIERRLAYVEALIASLSTKANVTVCDIELTAKSSTNTYDTYKQLQKQYPAISFIWLFGSDSVRAMHTWKGGDWLKTHLPILLVQRPRHELVSWSGKNITLLDVRQVAVSSTEVREKIAKGQSVDHLIPGPVAAVIK